MFTKIDIDKFGLFCNFNWQRNMREFRRVNIIYGRNYSGKTTLSRIFDCVAQGSLHKDYADGQFTLHTDQAACPTVTNSNLHYDGLVRVYNADYVSRNLSWLKNEEEGEILPFAMIGGDNIAAQQEIDRINEQLGSVDEKKGLLFAQAEKNTAFNNKNSHYERDFGELENQLKSKANNDIKKNNLYVKQGTTYNVNTIKADIEEFVTVDTEGRYTISDTVVLTDDERRELTGTVEETEKVAISLLSETEPHLAEYEKKVGELVTKPITMTKTLHELVENDLLQAWVDQGRSLNKDREVCAFCGNPISAQRWEELNAHFSKESDQLKKNLASQKETLVAASNALDGFLERQRITKENIYVAYAAEYEEVMRQWDEYVAYYKGELQRLIALVDARLTNIFKPVEIEDGVSHDDASHIPASELKSLIPILKAINELIKKNNAYGTELEKAKQKARKKLRLDYVHGFCVDINYVVVKERLDKEAKELEVMRNEAKTLAEQINDLKKQQKLKELDKKDEGKAAHKVTELLVDHFGNGSLSLEPETVEDDVDEETGEMKPRTRFVVKRGGEDAKNLSEGERSLISFCYFIAQMDDELSGDDAEKLVIFIDDPISSLDSSHVFFMYSLIDKKIAETNKYGQLFLSTHNLDFLKYLKRLSVPTEPSKEENLSHYVIWKRRRGDEDYRCWIEEMPNYLKDYVTEYNFLFEQIYEMATPLPEERGDKTKKYGSIYSLYYNIGNNMRKFLECYLFYRYPNTDDPMKNLGTLFEDYVPSEVNRVVNEYSHLAFGARGIRVVDVPEIEKAAKQILMAVKSKDPEHYKALCKSVRKDETIDFVLE